ncbi:acetyltransferase [Streptomyces sp. CB00316]|uniref:GNAT family N-acetyltransferase n=1 Tax=Streptomyces sp. CB00316 TaxID=1703932 RepID=UPI00093EBCAA|nr:GNAT family N-acetyltransferase [Streptomyces sp. CB00316]OKJ23469.1 acetyltransferase [Streptomyces sp. CB00316]
MNDHGGTPGGTPGPDIMLTAGTLLMRPWCEEDVPALLEAYDDPVMRQWVRLPVSTPEEAARWLESQYEGWESGTRFSFAVTDTGRGGELVGNLALKRPGPGPERAEVGYWTAARARGQGVAPRALEALTDWAFTAFAAEGLVRLELLHHVDNVASCRVAEKSGYAFAELLDALPPEFPLDGHLHVRRAPSASASASDGRVTAQRAPGVSPAGSSDSR